MSGTSRRKFMASALGSATALGIGSQTPRGLLQAAQYLEKDNGNVLVIIQLTGGNDGLNTIIPVDDPAYYKARAKIAVPKNQAVKVSDGIALHPSLRPLSHLFDKGLLTVVHGVGYEDPNRSHFESMDIWHTCQRKGDPRRLGWLGRFLDSQASPGQGGDVPAMHLGAEKFPLALAGRVARVPSIQSIDEFRLKARNAEQLTSLLQHLSDRRDTLPEQDLLGFVQSNTSSALQASQRVSDIRSALPPTTNYPKSGLADKLSVIAQLIQAEMATRIYYVELDGFDTHSQQPAAHAALLQEWSEALAAFCDDLGANDLLHQVSVLTFSEFGRRVAENASEGTDHGAAAPVFVAGGRLRTPLVGKQPSLTDLHDGDLKYAIDFRSVYNTLLQNWLGSSQATAFTGSSETLELYSG